MDESKQDPAFSNTDNETKKAAKVEPDTKFEKIHGEKDIVDETECYKMRNFAGSNNSATSLRLGSEEFEHISVSAIEDIEVPNGEESSIENNKDTNIDTGEMEKVEGESKYVECGNLGHTKDVIMNSNTKNPVVSCVVDDKYDNVEEAENHNIKGGVDEPDCNVNGTSELKTVQDGVGNDIKQTDNSTIKKSSSGLLEEPSPPERRVSFSLEEYMEERESMYNESRRASENIINDGMKPSYRVENIVGKGENAGNQHFKSGTIQPRKLCWSMENSYPDFAVKHSSGDLHSRLKTRKLLGVGETDDGDVHRSKLSQILGHSDQLYIRLPNGLRLWQIVLSTLLSIMAVWALMFPKHFFMFMYEVDGSSFTFPIRLYASALVCISVMYWSTIQASDRDLIRLVLLSSIVFFALQALVLMTCWLPWHSATPTTTYLCSVLTFAARLLVVCVSSYFYWITCKDGKYKDVKYYR